MKQRILFERAGSLRAALALVFCLIDSLQAQLIDRTMSPNALKEGIAKSLVDEIGAGSGDIYTTNSAAFIIARDPFRAIRRGRQLFQRKFAVRQGLGPRVQDGQGDINTVLAIG